MTFDGNVIYAHGVTENRIIESYNNVISNKGSFEDLKASLTEFETCAPSIVRYLHAKYFYGQGNLKDASRIISEVIQGLENSHDYVITFNNSNLRNIYGLAGEIYANNNQNTESKIAFQDYQLCLSRLKGLERNDSLLSFRRYNEFSLSDLINNEITVCSPRVMNDPYDTLLLKWGDFIRERNHKKHIEPFCDSFESYRIRSFSQLQSKDGKNMVSNILMWSHYADQHNGFCVQYRFSDAFLKVTENRRTVRLHEVQYQPEDIPLDLKLDEGAINTQIALCTKQHLWEYENEARMIAYEPDVSGYYNSIPLDDGSFIEKVFFGYRCPDKHIETIKRVLSNQEQIKFYKMESSPEDIYHLSYIEI